MVLSIDGILNSSNLEVPYSSLSVDSLLELLDNTVLGLDKDAVKFYKLLAHSHENIRASEALLNALNDKDLPTFEKESRLYFRHVFDELRNRCVFLRLAVNGDGTINKHGLKELHGILEEVCTVQPISYKDF